MTGAQSTDRRTRIFIGDVQGCNDALGELLDALRFDPARHTLWFTGDLVNRGPASLETLRRVRALGAGIVLGNHDLHLLGRAAGERPARPMETLDDVLGAPDRDELLAWLRAQPLVRVWDDILLVHAGLRPCWHEPAQILEITSKLEERIRAGQIPWKDPDLAFLTRVRRCDAEGRLPPADGAPAPGFLPWDHFYSGERIVVFGHWAQRGLVSGPRIRGLDSGCVWGGQLTAWIAEADHFVSVPARHAQRMH